MRVASVCSGIGGAELAFAGIAEHAFMAEIDPFARAVLQQHFPSVPLHGDFTEIEANGPVDVLIGGTPCQSFSIAGLRRGLADERGNLALEFLRLADRLRARWVLWENVPGVLSSGDGRDFGAFLGGLGELGYGFCYRVLDAQYFGLAQRRKRVFVVGCLGDWRRAAAVLFEPASLRGDTAPRREAGERATGTLAASSGGSDENDARDGRLIARCLNAHPSRSDGENETFIAHSLRAEGFDASEDGTGRGTPLVATVHSLNGAHSCTEDGTGRGVPLAVAFQTSQSGVRAGDTHATLDSNNGSRRHNGTISGSAVRRLTPTECERLQGYPDAWTAITYRGKPAADGPRYRALGNAFAVPVVRWIARRLVHEHQRGFASELAA